MRPPRRVFIRDGTIPSLCQALPAGRKAPWSQRTLYRSRVARDDRRVWDAKPSRSLLRGGLGLTLAAFPPTPRFYVRARGMTGSCGS
jgi:hypothetical protein